nr:MAG TPA: wound-inducible basic protein family protein [Bacteriophage sp.]
MSIGAICPEYDVNSPYLNSLFTGTEFAIKE